MSSRSTIIDNLETTLRSIQTDSDYLSQVKYVSRMSLDPAAIDRSKSPALAINEGGIEERIIPVGTKQRRRMIIGIEGIIRTAGPGKGSEQSEKLNNLKDDIEKAIASANLGANVIYHRLGEERSLVGEDLILLTYELIILYYYEESNP